MSPGRKLRSLMRHVFLLLILAFSIILLVNTFIHTRPVQQFLLDRLSNRTGLDIKTGDIDLHFFGGTGLFINNFNAVDREGRGSFRASRIDLTFDTRGLLSGKLIVAGLHMDQPVITVNLDHFDSLFDKHKKNSSRIKEAVIKKMTIRKGRVLITRGAEEYALSDLYFDARKKNPSPFTVALRGRGNMNYMGKKSPFHLDGDMAFSIKDSPFPDVDIMLQTEGTPLNWLYWSKFIEMKQGKFDAELRLRGAYMDRLSMEGRVFFESVEFDYIRNERSKRHSIPELEWDLSSHIAGGRRISIDSLTMNTHDLSLELEAVIDLKEMLNPYIDIMVKSNFMSLETFLANFPAPVTGDWLETDLFPVLERGYVRMDLLRMQGDIDQFRHIRESENRSIFTMALDCRDFIVSGEGIQVPFYDVSAMVDISEGNFHITDLTAFFGDSVIELGGLSVREMLLESRFFEFMVEGAFDIEDLLSQRNMNVIPSGAKESLENLRESRGRLECRTRIGYMDDWALPRILDGSFYFNEWKYHESFFSLPVSFQDIEFHVNENDENYFSGNGLWGNSAFTASGSIEIDGADITVQKAGINTIMDMNEAVSLLYQKKTFPFEFLKPLEWDFTLEQRDDLYDITGEADISELAVESEGITVSPSGDGASLEYNLSIWPEKGVILNHVLYETENTSLAASGGFDFRRSSPVNLNLMSSGLSIEDLGIGFTGTDSMLKGTLKGDVTLFFYGDTWGGIYLNGNLSGDGISYYSGYSGVRSPLIEDAMFRLEFTGKESVISMCTLSTGGNDLSVTGRIEGWNNIIFDLSMESIFFDLTDLILRDSSIESEYSVTDNYLFKNLDMNMSVNIEEGVWRKLEYSALKAGLVLKDGLLRIDNAQADLKYGKATIAGLVGGNSKVVDISGDIQLRKQPVDILFDEIGMGDRGIKGSMTLQAEYVIKSEEGKNPVEGLSGVVRELRIDQGLISNSRVFLKVLEFLNIPDKFRERPSDVRGEGFYFDSMLGSAVIKNGILTTDDYVVKSPVFNAAGSGEQNLILMEHDFRLLVQPLVNIDYILSHVPIVGRILVGEGETVFSVGYNVTGPWNQPELKIAPVENVKSLFGVLRRAIMTPVSLLNGLRNVIRGDREEPVNSEQ